MARAGVRFRQGRYAEAAQLCAKARPPARKAGRKDIEAHALYLESTAQFNSGADSTAGFEQALRLYRELDQPLGEANALNNLGFRAYHRGELDEAVAYWRQSIVARDRAGDVIGKATGQNNIAEVLSDQGQLTEAEALFTEALSVWRASGYRIGVGVATLNLGVVAMRRGSHEAAAARLHSALGEFESLGAQDYVSQTLVRLAENDLDRGLPREAEVHLKRVERLSGRRSPGLANVLGRIRDRMAASSAGA